MTEQIATVIRHAGADGPAAMVSYEEYLGRMFLVMRKFRPWKGKNPWIGGLYFPTEDNGQVKIIAKVVVEAIDILDKLGYDDEVVTIFEKLTTLLEAKVDSGQ